MTMTGQRTTTTNHATQPAEAVERQQLERLLALEADFISNPSFKDGAPDDDEAMLRFAELDATERKAGDAPGDLPAHLARLCETALLTAAEERDLFRAMNYLKYRVNCLRTRLDADDPDPACVARAERFYDAAMTIRDHIVQANMRLVISIVKKYVTPQYSFDELLSDGIETLMQAVDKFDYDRGFRFSTYAYRSIARTAFRQINERQKEFSRFAGGAEELAGDIAEETEVGTINEQTWHELRSMLAKMLLRLDRRERYIVRGRYAMGKEGKVKTFQSMADKLGVSKERVRQLEQRAVGKLRTMAAELGMPELFDPTLTQAG